MRGSGNSVLTNLGSGKTNFVGVILGRDRRALMLSS
jgi:hypothetical protein